MICVMASGSSWSPELWPEPPAPAADVDGRLEANDCVRFANDVIVRRERYVIRTVTNKRGVIFVKHWVVLIICDRIRGWEVRNKCSVLLTCLQ